MTDWTSYASRVPSTHEAGSVVLARKKCYFYQGTSWPHLGIAHYDDDDICDCWPDNEDFTCTEDGHRVFYGTPKGIFAGTDPWSMPSDDVAVRIEDLDPEALSHMAWFSGDLFRRDRKPGVVYLSQREDTPEFKIGFTAAETPVTRISAIQTGSAGKIVLLASIQSSKEMEQWLHHRFHKKKIRGEWFNLDIDDALSIVTGDAYGNTK